MNKLTIFRKGLLLVATPLLVQMIFIGVLIQTQVEVGNAQLWAVHTKEVIARVEKVYRRMLEGYAGIRIMVVSDDPAIGQPYRNALQNMSAQINELRELVNDNKPQQARIVLIADQSHALRSWLADEERLILAGERGKALDQLDDGARMLTRIRTMIDEVLTQEAQLDDNRMRRLDQATARQVTILVGGGLAFLGTTLALMILFLHGMIKRLAVLRDNARSYAAGTGLVPPLIGSDEIAEVDRAFHEMAMSLDQQKQENEMFVYSVSHDLRSPLINLQGFSEELSLSYGELQGLFRHEEIPPEVRRDGLKLMTENIDESIRYIQTAVGRLARIIDALLRLSRAGRVEYQWQSLNIATIVQTIVDALHDSISTRKAEVILHVLPPAWGDPTAVEQIFANLITNAVHYLDQSKVGKIEVGSTASPLSSKMGGFRVYYVKDNGLGIPAAYHQRVFTAFSRLQTNVAQGEGIGLALVRRMVERHGGKIWMESAAGVGTTFFVALPASPPADEQSKIHDRPPPATTLGSRGEHGKWQPSQS